jgi:hypothetical protein
MNIQSSRSACIQQLGVSDDDGVAQPESLGRIIMLFQMDNHSSNCGNEILPRDNVAEI